MFEVLLVNAAVILGQLNAPGAPRGAVLLPPIQPPQGAFVHQVKPAEVVTTAAEACPQQGCGNACGHGGCREKCHIDWVRRWKCEDLEMKCAERKHGCCGIRGLLFCPKDCEEEEEEEGCKRPETPLMQLLYCRLPGIFDALECRKTKIYGWTQTGFTANWNAPADRLNFATNFANRSNDFRLNQAPYIVVEKTVDPSDDRVHIGYRLDWFVGHDTPYYENTNGIFADFLGDRLETSRLTEFGMSIPQAYTDLHLPILTKRGIDIRVGRFYTLMGYEVAPAPQTDFYSHTLEFFTNAYTHTGVMTIAHIADTVDLYNGYVRGWEVVFDDVNDTGAYHGGLGWKSCDQRDALFVSWYTGPDQVNNNRNFRTTFSAYYTKKFGSRDQWRAASGGLVGFEPGAAADPITGAPQAAEWYNASSYLFYTINPKWTLGARMEVFRDDDGVRTPLANSDAGGATWNRPGFAGTFYDLTFGITWKPMQNLRIRPEMRFDWFNGRAVDGSNSQPFNDRQNNFQATTGFDVVYEF